MHNEKDPYKKLRADLKGHYPAIAQNLGCDQSYISMVLTGKRKSDKVVKAALDYALSLKSKVEKLQSDLENYNESSH